MERQTDEEKVRDINLRLDQLKAERAKFVPRWQEAERFVSPTVYNWSDLGAIPELPRRFSSKPCNYLSTLVSGLTGYSVSQSISWFKLQLETSGQNGYYGAKDWLEDVEECIYAQFARSNLYKEVVPFIRNAATVGHGVMLIDENLNENKLHFTCMRNNEIFLDCNSFGEIDTVYRTYLMTLREMVQFFGLEALCDSYVEDYKTSRNWNDKHEVLQAVFPRADRDEKKLDSKNKLYACVFVDREHNTILLESGYDEMPYAVFEWQQYPGLAYGGSPAIDALPSIKSLNIIQESALRIAQMSSNPPVVLPDYMRDVSLVPGGLNYVSNPQDTIQAVRTGENYNITLNEVSNAEQVVKDWFHVDFFLMLQQKRGQMTATEVTELQGEKSAILSDLIVALNASLQTIISRSFNILMRNQLLPPPPETLAGASMKVDFIGPLAQAQKKYHTMGGIAQALSLAGPIMQMFPNAGDYLDADEIMKRAMEGQGMPQRAIREDKDVEELRSARAKEQQAQQQAALQQQALQSVIQNADKLNKPAAPNSLLESLSQEGANVQA